MDNTSIITQVANPKEEENLSCQEKGKMMRLLIGLDVGCFCFDSGITAALLLMLLRLY